MLLLYATYLLCQLAAESAWLGLIAIIAIIAPAVPLCYFLGYLTIKHIDGRLQQEVRRIIGWDISGAAG